MAVNTQHQPATQDLDGKVTTEGAYIGSQEVRNSQKSCMRFQVLYLV